jgi:hypothetical protein
MTPHDTLTDGEITLRPPSWRDIDDVPLNNLAGQQWLHDFGFKRDSGIAGVCRLQITRERWKKLWSSPSIFSPARL